MGYSIITRSIANSAHNQWITKIAHIF